MNLQATKVNQRLSEQLENQKRLQKATWATLLTRYFTLSFAFLSLVILVGVFAFILYRSINAFQFYGFSAILLSNQFDLNDRANVSFWLPFFATFLTSLIAILIALPIGLHTAIFIKFRIPKRYRKATKIIIETLAGVPSVVFGLFAIESLRVVVNYFGISSFSILNASIMLAFMVLPTIVALVYNALENVDLGLFNNSIALGVSKTHTIYKIYLKAIKSSILVAVILATARAIGEAMALSMLLQSESDYNFIGEEGLGQILTSNIKTITVVIATNMFTENANENSRSLLFAFGFLLFVLITLLNLVVFKISNRKKQRKITIFNQFFTDLKFLWSYVSLGFEYLFFPLRRKVKINDEQQMVAYIQQRCENYKFKNSYGYFKIALETLAFFLCFAFLTWLTLQIFGNGLVTWFGTNNTVFAYGQNTTGQAFLNTFLIIIISIVVGFVISLFTAIYLNEFAKNQRLKRIISFFLDSLGATPSILLGIFGLIFFIQTLGLTSNGTRGFSLFAGSLTIAIVIFPLFARSIQQALSEVSNDIRLNGLALGATNFQIVKKLILPIAFNGLVTAIILAVGRVLSESAPLYLTAGLTGTKQIALSNPGQTLTTRIYAQLYNSNVGNGLNIMYEAAFLTMILVFLLIILGYYVLPNWGKIRETAISYWSNFLFYTKNYCRAILVHFKKYTYAGN